MGREEGPQCPACGAAAVTIGSSTVAMASGTPAGIFAGGMTIGLLLTFVLALVSGYFAVVGIVNFAREDRFGAAFDVVVLKKVGLNGDFAIPWLVTVIIFMVVGLVVGIPFIGFFIGPFVGFYAAVVAADLWASGFSEALDPRAPVERPGGEEPAV